MAKEQSLANLLAKELGYKDAKDLKKRLGGGETTSVAENIKGRLRSGEGFFSSMKGGLSDTGEAIAKKINPKNVGKDVYKNLIAGDNIFSAYLQGRGKGKEGEEDSTSPTPEGKEQGGLTENSVTYLQILAKNSMSIPWMARDINVLRQNLIKLTKLKGGKEASTNKADTWFLREDEREAALEAQKTKLQGPKPGGKEKEGGGEGGGGLIDTIMSFFSGGFMKAIRFIFNPRMLSKIFSKVFVPLAIIGTLFEGITAGFKRYQETGSLTDAISAGLGGMLEFVTFGLFGEDTLNQLWTSISDFFAPITESISNIFKGIKDFVKGLFPGLGGEDTAGDKPAEPPKPTQPNAKDFTAEGKSGDGAKTPTSDAASKGDTAKKIADAENKPASETSPTANKATEAPAQATPVTSTDTPTPTTQAPTTPSPMPSANLSTADQIKQIEGYIDANEQSLATRERNVKERIAAYKKAHENEPDKVTEFTKQENESLNVYRKQIDDANDQHKQNLDKLKKGSQSSPSVAAAPPSAGVASSSTSSPSESGGGGSAPSVGGGTPPSAESGSTAPSGSEINNASSAVAEGQRMESSADAGMTVNAPKTTNNTNQAGKEPTQISDVYDSEFAKLISSAVA